TEVAEPLLVDPAIPGRPHGQMVGRGQAVAADLATAHERKPSVLVQNARQSLRQDDGERDHDHRGRGIPLDRTEEPPKERDVTLSFGDEDCVHQRFRRRFHRSVEEYGAGAVSKLIAYLETLRPRILTSIATTRTATTINKIHQIIEHPRMVGIFLRPSMRRP